ncbi:MAG TPA: MFS transporter [Gemmataceae bacterium]|nr:MFS transporter [Gemmataceae bacterium]
MTSGLTRREWLLILVLSAVQFTHILDFVIMMPLGPQFKKDLHLSDQWFGFLVSAYAFSAALAGLLAAWFIDRFDRKTALMGLYAGFTLGTLCCAAAPNYAFLLAARALTGAFGGVVAACILAIVGDAFPGMRRGRAMGAIMSAFSVASIVGIPAGLYLANDLNWRAPFAALAFLGAAVLVLVGFVLPSMRGHLVRGRQIVNVWSIFCEPTHLRAYLLMTALVLSSFLIVPYLASYLVANTGRTETELPYVYLCGGLATLVTMTFFGWLSDRFGKLPVFRCLALFTLVPILLLTNLPVVHLATTLMISTLFMVTTSGRMVPAIALITASSVPGNRGSFLSVNASVQQAGAGLAAALGGLMLGQGPNGEMTGFSSVGVLACVATLLSIWLAGHLRPAVGGEDATLVLDLSAEDSSSADGRLAEQPGDGSVAVRRDLEGSIHLAAGADHLRRHEDILHVAGQSTNDQSSAALAQLLAQAQQRPESDAG